jgi:hypothetical protein
MTRRHTETQVKLGNDNILNTRHFAFNLYVRIVNATLKISDGHKPTIPSTETVYSNIRVKEHILF